MPSQSVVNGKDGATYTASNGRPFENPYAAERVGKNGPLLLQDFHLIDLLAHFDRERIPERVVHAKGSGAHGEFVVTHGLSDLCASKFLGTEGSKCPVVVRFSTVGGESGSADTARDPRGFSVKFKTPEGNWDHVYNNTPVFFLRDPSKFPHFIHTQKRDPQTHLKDADMFWDYLAQNPEAFHQVMILFGDRGVPDGYRFMHGYAGHTHKLVKPDGSFVYCQFHWRSNQGIKFLTQEKSVELAGLNPDYATQDLFEAIERGEHPSWTLYVQTMTPEEAEKFRYNVFDLTKIWSHGQFPLREVGKMTLNKNPENYFAEVEQVAFSPSHLIEGIEPSADPVLQSRLFSYPDTHRHRLGVNYQQIPVNKPLCPVANFQRDGFMAIDNQGSRPNYISSIQPLSYKKAAYTTERHEKFVSAAIVEMSEVTELDFEQPRVLWERIFDDGAKERFVNNVSGHLGNVKTDSIKKQVVAIFGAISPDLGERVGKAVGTGKVAPLKVAAAESALRFGVDMEVPRH